MSKCNSLITQMCREADTFAQEPPPTEHVCVTHYGRPPPSLHLLNGLAHGAALYLLFKTQAMTEIHFQFIFQSYGRKRGKDYSIESSSGW